MRNIFLFIVLGCLVFKASAQTPGPDRASIKASYDKAKLQFSEYEKIRGRFIETDNVNMHYLTWGNPSNPCLIWAHGSLNNGYELIHIAESLAKAGFYIIAIDYYGHGQTPIPEHEVSIYHVADDINFLMNKLSINKAFIGGFSRGGYMATAFYDSYPERVLGLILEDGGSVAANAYYHQLNTQELEIKAQLFEENERRPWSTVYNSEFEAYQKLYEIDGEATEFSTLALIKKVDSKKWAIIYSEMMGLFHLQDKQSFLDLTLRPTKVPLFARSMVMMDPVIIFRNLNVPVLILDPTSEQDPMPFEKENEKLKNQYPDLIDHIIYKNIGHNIHYEHPKQFTQDLRAFMKKALAKGHYLAR